jgi:hypothetical protein
VIRRQMRAGRFGSILALAVLLVSALPATANATWQPLGALSAGTGPADQPQAAVDANGNAVFVWRRSDGTTNCSGAPCLRIQTRSRSSAGVLSPIKALTASGRQDAFPQVAVDTNGNAVFVWQRSDGVHMRIQTRVRSSAGTLSATQVLSAPGQDRRRQRADPGPRPVGGRCSRFDPDLIPSGPGRGLPTG